MRFSSRRSSLLLDSFARHLSASIVAAIALRISLSIKLDGADVMARVFMGFYSKHVFPRLMDWSLRAPEQQEQRRRALSHARGETLEIGFGTGLNLPHYTSEVTRLTVADSARVLRGRVERRIAAARVPVREFQLDASDRLPFNDESFETVVTTWTLCSIRDVTSALYEIRRVLKPDGQYLFMEHGRSENPRVARWQDIFNPAQKIVGCGCNINRSIDRLIREAGLRIGTLERFAMPNVPRLLGEMYRGTAQPE